MKRIISALLATALALTVTACGSSESSTAQAPQVKEPPVLEGTWNQVNSNSETSYQQAVIQGDTMEIYWVSDNDTKSLYWSGSFTAPKTADEPYVWESTGDTEAMAFALLASQDESKTFTYEDGQISYDVSALGTTQTVRLELAE